MNGSPSSLVRISGCVLFWLCLGDLKTPPLFLFAHSLQARARQKKSKQTKKTNSCNPVTNTCHYFGLFQLHGVLWLRPSIHRVVYCTLWHPHPAQPGWKVLLLRLMSHTDLDLLTFVSIWKSETDLYNNRISCVSTVHRGTNTFENEEKKKPCTAALGWTVTWALFHGIRSALDCSSNTNSSWFPSCIDERTEWSHAWHSSDAPMDDQFGNQI